ncbi:aminoglycoside phosphotransferase family protein [Oceanobacillus piezotolerans]|uniref:Aminoglycoside phosphotransferase family protein n=1 Tax=Oceanobacillus piezotolerans TaxID=2448030 RepID=A0A498DB22_9BACI|nr:aminoglycoside phosphotransferase family protein [Oceanobacillus piezotolerans]RLL48324.1 aminoglycoside phosphotransferase family protein [Oceanobacillus piezotolerans]
MNGKEILNRFGFKVKEEPISIYPYSPVYLVRHGDDDFIVKRTQRKARQVMAYTSMLKDRGVNVVTPVKLTVDNPQKFNESNFVVYPFIEGNKYSGEKKEILEAGKLLGLIHRLSPVSNVYDLLEYNIYDFNEQEVEESMEAIKHHADKAGLKIDTGLKAKLLESVEYQAELSHAELPHVASPHDFKANNLVFIPEPFLIDPDNASWIPRIFDLALALLLFHNEHREAPDRIFTIDEWNLFLSGYKEYVTLTDKEKFFWKKSIQHIFLDEVMWLMAEFEKDWQNPSQQNLFNNLIEIVIGDTDYN